MPEKNDDTGDAAAAGAICGLTCLVLGAGIAYTVFGIIFMVKDRHVCQPENGDSNLWIWCLMSYIGNICTEVFLLIMSSIFCPPDMTALPDGLSDEEKMKEIGRRNGPSQLLQTAFRIIVLVAFFITGSTLLNGGICDNLKETGLYVWFLLTYVVYCLLLFACIATSIMTLMLVNAMTDGAQETKTDSKVEETQPLTYQNADDLKSV